MKNSRNKFIYFGILLFAGILFADTISAARNNTNGKRASKSKTKTPRKKITATVVAEDISEERAASSVRARGDTPASTTTTTAVDEDTAAEVLADKLMSCVSGMCNGDVLYEKCFKNANDPESFIRNDTTCYNMYNAADTDMIKIKARNIITSKIKGYFSEACESAGGKIKGNDCEIDVWYYAKAGGKSDKKLRKSMGFKIGKTVTCSYTQFGYQDQDMEYKEEMTGEQLGAIIQSGMGMVSGLMTTGFAIADSVSASKELKKKNIIKGKKCAFVYNYGADHISVNGNHCDFQIDSMCDNDGKKSCADSSKSEVDITDSQGRHYKGTKANGAEEGKKAANINKDDAVSCNSLNSSKWVKEGADGKSKYDKCYVEIEEWTDLAIQEKEAELYKKFTDFNKLQTLDALGNAAIATEMQKTFGNNNQTQETVDFYVDRIQVAPSDSVCVTEATKYSGKDDISDVRKCKMIGQAFTLYDTNRNFTGYGFSCSCPKKVAGASNQSGTNSYLTSYNNLLNGTTDTNSALGQVSTNNYSSAVETYNSMQKSVNENKSKITQLEQRKSEGLSTAISSGASTLLQQGGSLATSIVAANSNVGTMTGACYIGDPEKGGRQFLSEGGVKKLTWNSI